MTNQEQEQQEQQVRNVTIEFEITGQDTIDIHELLCLSIHEGDLVALDELAVVVSDIKLK